MVSSAVALALELAVILWRCRARLRFVEQPERLDGGRHIASTVVSLAGGAVSNTVQLQAYRVLFPLSDRGALSGIYGIVSNVGAAAMAACASIYAQIESPKIYQSQGKSVGQFVKRAVLMSVGMLTVVLAGSSFLVEHLTQPKYVPYAMAAGFGVIVEACNLIIGGYGIYLMLHQRTMVLLYLHILGAVIAVLGCLAVLEWAPQSPLLIGVALAGSQLLITPLIGLVVMRHIKESR